MRKTEKELFQLLIGFGGEPSARTMRNEYWKIILPWPIVESNRVYCKKHKGDAYLIEASGRAAELVEAILGTRDAQRRTGATEYSIWFIG
jgi:hypothetical protein